MGGKKPLWARRRGESAHWYSCFELYRLLGPNRSLDGAFRLTAALAASPARLTFTAWESAAARWNWVTRAAAWDATEDARLHELYAGQPPDPLALRLSMVDELLRAVYAVLVNADLEDMSKEEVRRNLPTLRVFFRDLVAAHRDDTGRGTADAPATEIVPFTADELAAAQRGLVDWRAHWDSTSNGAPGAAATLQTLRDVLAMLYPDEVSIRRVAMQAQLDVAHIGFSPRAVDTWHAVLQEATHSGRLDELVDEAAGEYPEHPGLRQAIDALRQTFP